MTEKESQSKLIRKFENTVKAFFRDYILIELPEDVNCWVAGGALRDFYLYGYIKGETDIDIFTTCQENFDKIIKRLSEFYDIKKETDFAITFTDKDDEEKIVQVIKIFYETPQNCLQNFDLTCCCAYIGMGGTNIDFFAINDFYDDNYNKRLKLIKLNDNPNCTLSRIRKYVKKGFSISDVDLLDMVKCYLEGNIDFDKLIEDYKDILKLQSSWKGGSIVKWWGYVHTSGSIQGKRYFDERDTQEAEESPFVAQVIYPFEAEDREHAIIYINHQRRG